MGQSPATSPGGRPEHGRPSSSRRSSYLSELDIDDDDVDLLQGDERSSGHVRLQAMRGRALGWKDQVVIKVEENAGLCLIALSQGLFACMNLSVKILQDHGGGLPVLELIAIRMAITLIGCIAWLHRTNDPNPFFGPPEMRKMLALRGFVGFFGLSGMYQSLKYLSLSDATTLSFLTPTCTALLGYLFLRESFTRKECAAGLISLAGVLLIARPAALFGSSSSSSSPHQTPITVDGISRTPYLSHQAPVEYMATTAQRMESVAYALMGVMGGSAAYTTIRAIGKRATPFHSIAYFSFYCVLVSIVGMIFLGEPPVWPSSLSGWFMILIIGIFGLGAQVFVTMGLQREKAGRGTLAIYTQLLFATILERLVFGITPSWLSVLGTLIILSAALWVALSKKESKPRDAESGLAGLANGLPIPLLTTPNRSINVDATEYSIIPTTDRPNGDVFVLNPRPPGSTGLSAPAHDGQIMGRRASVNSRSVGVGFVNGRPGWMGLTEEVERKERTEDKQ